MKKLIFLLSGLIFLLLIINQINSVGVGTYLNNNGYGNGFYISNCYSNDDCDDSNPFTSDICVNPEAFDSNCINTHVNCLIIDNYTISPAAIAGEYTYSTILIKNNCGGSVNLTISGTDFYDSSSSGAKCPITNQFALTNIKYYATKGAYSTIQDPRADNDGYVLINYGVPGYPEHLGNPDSIIINNDNSANILHSGEDISLTFKTHIPEPCRGNFDSGNVYIIGTNPENSSQETSIQETSSGILIFPDILTKINLSLANNLTLVRDNSNLDPNTKYLFEGDSLSFDVLVYSSGGNSFIYYAVVTTGTSSEPGNDVKANCIKINNINSTTVKYHCLLKVENSENMYGEYIVGAEAGDLDGKSSYVYLGNFFFNQKINCSSDSECNDDNPNSKDICLNPGTKESYCENTLYHPEAIIAFNQNSNDFEVNGFSDNNLDVSMNKEENCVDRGILANFCTRTYVITDELGNKIELMTSMKNYHNFIIQNKIISIKYNSEEKINLNNNEFGIINVLNKQYMIFKSNKKSIIISYDSKNKKSFIQIKDNENTETRNEEGLVSLKLKTDEGNINYDFENVLKKRAQKD